MSTHPKIVPLAPIERRPDAAESALIARAQDQDLSAWEAIYENTYDRIYRRVRFLTGDRSSAEELTQETYVQAMLSIGEFRGGSSLSTWLSAVALNLVRKRWRRKGATRRAHAGLELVRSVMRSSPEQPDADLIARNEEDALREAVEELPEKLREVFVLRYLEGVPCKEVAQILGIKENNVSVRANRARIKVRDILVERGVLDEEGRA